MKMIETTMLLCHLSQTQQHLAKILVHTLDDDEKQFLVSLKRGTPEWIRLGIEHLAQLPTIQWKLFNIHKMDSAKHKTVLDRLIEVLSA